MPRALRRVAGKRFQGAWCGLTRINSMGRNYLRCRVLTGTFARRLKREVGYSFTL